MAEYLLAILINDVLIPSRLKVRTEVTVIGKAHSKGPEKINKKLVVYTFRWPMVGISLADSYMIKY